MRLLRQKPLTRESKNASEILWETEQGTVPGKRADLFKIAVVTARHIDRVWHHKGKCHIQKRERAKLALRSSARLKLSCGESTSHDGATVVFVA